MLIQRNGNSQGGCERAHCSIGGWPNTTTQMPRRVYDPKSGLSFMQWSKAGDAARYQESNIRKFFEIFWHR